MVEVVNFWSRPKLATRNLPADAVDKVQVYDKKSDQTAFTGIDDGTKTKTINLELKEEKRNAAFGNDGGAGTNDRFTAKANINRFRFGINCLLGMGNNVNEQGFSIGDAMNFSGGGQQMAVEAEQWPFRWVETIQRADEFWRKAKWCDDQLCGWPELL